MKHLFLVTQCQYTVKGITSLMQERCPDIVVHSIKSPWEIVRSVLRGVPAEGSALLVIMPQNNARARVQVLWFAWTFHRLLCEYVYLQGISRFIIAPFSEVPAACRYWIRLEPRYPNIYLQTLLLSAMRTRAVHRYPVNAYRLKITPREKLVLNNFLRGIPDRVIARRLRISTSVLSTYRASLIKKLGLKSRYDFLRLRGMNF